MFVEGKLKALPYNIDRIRIIDNSGRRRLPRCTFKFSISIQYYSVSIDFHSIEMAMVSFIFIYSHYHTLSHTHTLSHNVQRAHFYCYMNDSVLFK